MQRLSLFSLEKEWMRCTTFMTHNRVDTRCRMMQLFQFMITMFVLEPIHMLVVNLTTYTYHNLSMTWHITYTIEACISQSICNDLCWFAMVPRRLIVMYVLWNGLLFPMPAWPGCWSQPEGWYYVSITVYNVKAISVSPYCGSWFVCVA